MIRALIVAALSTVIGASGAPLTLDRALARSRAVQPALRQARGTLDAAGERVEEARGGFLPQVSAQAQYQLGSQNFVLSPAFANFFGKVNPNGYSACVFPGQTAVPCAPAAIPRETLTPYSFYSLQVQANQPIWDFGRTLNAVGATHANEASSRDDLTTTVNQVALNVRTAFFGALASQELVGVAAKAVEQFQKHLDLAKGRLEVGAGARFDVSKAEADLANAQIQLLQAKNNFDVSRALLNQAMGTPGPIDYPLVPQAAELTNAIPDIDEGTETALKARPDLRSLSEKIEAQRKTLLALNDAYYPVLAANGLINWSGYSLPLTYNWQVGATLTVPILNGGIDYHHVREARSTLDALEASRDTLALQVRVDVESAVLTAKQSRAAMDAARAQVLSAKDALELSEGQYQTGVGNIIALSDSESGDLQARVGLIQAGYTFETALARLRYALGGD